MDARFFRFATEDNLQLQGLLYAPAEKTAKAFLHIHGMSGNFYENNFLDAMAERIVGAGYAFVPVNTRGHDFVADFVVLGPEEKYKRIGDAFEKMEDCEQDIKAAIDYLAGIGYTDIVLCGHSLGAVKVAYYMKRTRDARVKKLVLMSPPDMVGLAEAESDFSARMKEAQELIAAGRGDELLVGKIWDWYYLSANTYVNLSSRDTPVDIFNVYAPEKPSALSEITVPTLAILGEKDDALPGDKREGLEILKKKASATTMDTAVIEGAPHSYFGREAQMAETITTWLA